MLHLSQTGTIGFEPWPNQSCASWELSRRVRQKLALRAAASLGRPRRARARGGWAPMRTEAGHGLSYLSVCHWGRVQIEGLCLNVLVARRGGHFRRSAEAHVTEMRGISIELGLFASCSFAAQETMPVEKVCFLLAQCILYFCVCVSLCDRTSSEPYD